MGEPIIRSLLQYRAGKGKEDPARLSERRGVATLPRPSGSLIWVHVASVGEAQSVLALIDMILAQIPQAQILITSITTTSAGLLEARLPERAFHQYVPVDHPDWVRRFLDHWKPDLVLWAESELWPNTLELLKKRNIPTALLNARISDRSYARWRKVPRLIEDMLSVFLVVLAQTDRDAENFRQLGARSIAVTDNIKYSATPLPCDEVDLETLRAAIGARPVWLYASTHDGEEDLACRTHLRLRNTFPDLLTIIVPRHPARKTEIETTLRHYQLTFATRGQDKVLPARADQIYLADTMGELGLFYRCAPFACIGRSFSRDGGGGHNPIEPAMLHCAVLHGPNVQNLADIYAGMDDAGAAVPLSSEADLAEKAALLLTNAQTLQHLQDSGYAYAGKKAQSLNLIARELEPAFLLANLPVLKAAS